jgi:hypothetical protein
LYIVVNLPRHAALTLPTYAFYAAAVHGRHAAALAEASDSIAAQAGCKPPGKITQLVISMGKL